MISVIGRDFGPILAAEQAQYKIHHAVKSKQLPEEIVPAAKIQDQCTQTDNLAQGILVLYNQSSYMKVQVYYIAIILC